MGRLVYSMHVSLDGFIADAEGSIDFSSPPDDVHAAANAETRASAGLLYGRRLHEMMEPYWTDIATRDDVPAIAADFARAYVETPRWVFSDTVAEAPDGVTLVRRADARATVVRLLDEVDGPLHVGGADLAASLVDLVDEFAPVVFPVVVGGGRRFWPERVPFRLRLADQHVFDSGIVRQSWRRVD
ncbi:dihydrofolate reductase family protein [Salsipaludibacter albus]|uniref:dihydrofolate reductase family protein n=1 Tax=Salsipaludibacter albus TaxID=2849650 RepID=UPI001EE3F3B6|nr:dihydrofolate reductase family protein [Salsipaludibacter albus]MBY5162037.1 dihydrofolate reductase family protein [Salsipaludibacter albus]